VPALRQVPPPYRRPQLPKNWLVPTKLADLIPKSHRFRPQHSPAFIPVRSDWDTLKLFAENLMSSRDIDPIYPVLRSLYDARGYTAEDALWCSILYVTFYNLPSALEARRRLGPSPELSHERIDRTELSDLPTGVERRGMRGAGKVAQYLHGLYDCIHEPVPSYRQANLTRHLPWSISPIEPVRSWLRRGELSWNFTPCERGYRVRTNYRNFRRRWDAVPGNGRWSGFKLAEILRVVHHMPYQAPDMDLEHSSGPKEGLQWLYATHQEDATVLNGLAEQFRFLMMRPNYDYLDWEVLETILCNMNSLGTGHYYVGHDIDEFQGQIERAALHKDDRRDLLIARREALPYAYLGEHHGWSGVQRNRLAAWRNRREVVLRP
jgi:hypothetical protein